LHAYDLDELRDKIVVRWAVDGENLRLLDGREIELADDVLVIADAEGAIGMAGIMGGDRTGVSADTRNVFLEAAHFSPSAIAGRPRRFGLHTDASVRFERGVDPEGPARAIERASKLLTDIAGGTVGPTDVNENLESVPRRKPVDLRHSRVQSVLGMALSPEQIEMCLGRLEMDHERLKEGWRVTPPSFRFDVTIEEDLVEEVGRIIGYDLIPTVVGHGAAHLGRAPEGRVPEERVADLLIDRGYNEVITYSFIDERLEEFVCPGQPPIRLLNPISADLGAMRRSLWPGLLLAAQRNLSNQLSDFRLFECGPQFADKPRIEHEQVLAGLATGARQAPHWDTKPVPVDFYDIKADIESVLDLTGNAVAFSFVAGEHPALMPGQTARIRRGDAPIGWVGALHPRLQLELDIKQPLFLFALRCEAAFESGIPVYSAYSRFPSIRRDIAIVVDERISAAELEEEVMKSAGPHLREVVIFDLYRGPGIDATRKSVGLGLILQNASRTLTDGDGESAVRSVTRHLERELGARIRT
jgi:phenylalanyl-tRNA synthetase beta chain